MKLASIYSNVEEVFPTIRFSPGFNVVFARVKDPFAREKDSHNLGKTFLISVIDFLLIADIDNEHPFRKHKDIFGDLIFFLEIETHTGDYVTVRRSAEAKSPLYINVSVVRNENLSGLKDVAWTYPDLSMKKARETLSGLLNLSVLSPDDYRKGLSYVMRRQSDYNDVFRTSKFVGSKDVYWKPFVAQLLGFDRGSIAKKYAIDSQISDLEARRKILEQEAGSKSSEYDELNGLIQIREDDSRKMRQQLDSFDFSEIEAEINERLIDDIESRISNLNKRRYMLDYEIREIEKSLQTTISFDLDTVKELFNEVEAEISTPLLKSYQDVIEFNERMSSRRSERLRETYELKRTEQSSIKEEILIADRQRQIALRQLEQNQTMRKYQGLQNIVMERETKILSLRQRLSQLDKAAVLQTELETVKQEQRDLVKTVRDSIRSENSTYRSIRTTFSNCVEDVLNVQALISINVNNQGNLDFGVRTLDRQTEGRETSEASGTSYKKVLCACFDLALLEVYADEPFYHFVYHDGIFEGLDNRKKVNLLQMIREACEAYKLQYILTVIDSDLPRDERDNKAMFDEADIIRELHDLDHTGRLFRTNAF